MIEVVQHVVLQEPGLAGQEEAAAREARFTSLVERYSRFVYRVAYAILRNPDDCEDVVQETFLRIYRKSAWESIQDERAFLACTAWRIAVGKLPRIRHQIAGPELPSNLMSPEDTAIRANWNQVVHRLVDTLPEELRQPLALSTVEELNSRQIAQVMGIPEGTVRTRLMRARQILKQKLAGLMGGGYDK
jgi:RNA polymerase sigma-70 factor (ECF subfamily)